MAPALPRPHQLALRIPAGAFVLNSGLSKRGLDEMGATGLHGMASNAYPQLKHLRPEQFARLLSAGEIALGTALLVPFVPSAVAGIGLVAFAGGLVGLYLRTPGMRQEGSLRPTHEGIGLAKDVWLLAIGLALAIEDLGE